MGKHTLGPLFIEQNYKGKLYLNLQENTVEQLHHITVRNCLDNNLPVVGNGLARFDAFRHFMGFFEEKEDQGYHFVMQKLSFW